MCHNSDIAIPTLFHYFLHPFLHQLSQRLRNFLRCELYTITYALIQGRGLLKQSIIFTAEIQLSEQRLVTVSVTTIIAYVYLKAEEQKCYKQ